MAYSYATDIVHARRLAKHIEKYGVRVSIELQAGAGGSGWVDVRHRLNMSHHTVSRPSNGMTPCLRLVKVGRSDVPGPLCNGYMGYDRVYRIITLGRANHPGAGGPITLDGLTIPKDNGRPYIWGTEFEGGLEPWTREMHEAMAAANAGITDWLAEDHGRTIQCNLEHKDWAPRRKIDRLGYTRELSMSRIQAFRNAAGGLGGAGQSPIITTTVPEEDKMTPEQAWTLTNVSNAVGAIQQQTWAINNILANAVLPALEGLGADIKALPELDADTIAALIPDALAAKVADLLAARLSS